jgi:DNA repair protein RadC
LLPAQLPEGWKAARFVLPVRLGSWSPACSSTALGLAFLCSTPEPEADMSDARHPAVDLSEVADSSQFQAVCAGTNPETWEGAHAILPMLSDGDLRRSIFLLTTVGSLGGLLTLGPLQLAALGILSQDELDRFAALPALASRLLVYQARQGDQSTRGDLAREICSRGMQWDTVHVGIIGWDGSGRRVVDQVIAIGTTRGAKVDVRQAIRIGILHGAVSVVLWNYLPTTKIELGAYERMLADELRVMASAVGVGVEDVIFVSASDALSLAMLDQWPK